MISGSRRFAKRRANSAALKRAGWKRFYSRSVIPQRGLFPLQRPKQHVELGRKATVAERHKPLTLTQLALHRTPRTHGQPRYRRLRADGASGVRGDLRARVLGGI